MFKTSAFLVAITDTDVLYYNTWMMHLYREHADEYMGCTCLPLAFFLRSPLAGYDDC